MVRLVRELDNGHCTQGKMILPGGAWFYSLERPWLDNRNGVSCIPTGIYHGVWRQRPNKTWTYWLHDVPDRTFILIHTGNVVKHVEGCIMLGLMRGRLRGEPAVFNSGPAVRRFEEILGRAPFTLEVV